MRRHKTLPLLALAAAFPLVAADFTVSGVVVDSQSNRPLANARVVLAPTTARVQKFEQVTKQDGRFSFALTQAGKYTLQISKPGYPQQSYRSPEFTGLSSAIAVRADQDTAHIVFPAKRGGVISGQIKDDDSEPVANALVTIFESAILDGEPKILLRGQTRANDAGQFRVPNLPAGNYYICAMGRPWFADSLIQLQEAQRMTEQAMQRVAAARADHDRAKAQSEPDQPTPNQPEPDDDAQDTEPQTAVSPPQFSSDPGFHGTAFQTTFYPRAPIIEEASLIHVDVGREAQVAITLPVAKAVSVKATIDVSGAMTGGRANLFTKAYDQYVLFLDTTVAKNGAFEFKNVPAGSYEIVAASDSASGGSSWQVRQEVEVGASDMDVRLTPAPMGAIAGHVNFESESPPSGVLAFIILRNQEGHAVRIQVDPEGNFSLARIVPGRYEVAAGSENYVAAYFIGPSGEHLPLAIEIASGEPIHRDLVLTKAVSVIEGTVEKESTVEKTGSPQVGALVLLLPKNSSDRWAYRRDQTDSDGSYRLAAIPSGDYSLIALSDGANVVAYRDAKIAAKLIAAGKPVHIENGDRLDLRVEVTDTAALNLPAPGN